MKIENGLKHKEQLAEHFVAYWKTRSMDYPKEWTMEYIEKGHKTEITDEKFFVAVENDVAGSIFVVLWEGRIAELRDFYVRLEYRKQGIGTRLFDETIKFCKKKGVRKITAKIFPNLLEFVKGYGFVEEGLLRSHFAEGEDLIIVGKFLP